MRLIKLGAAALLTAAAAATAGIAAPVAVADSCDPAVTTCDGGAVPPATGSMDFSPPVTAPEDQYPGEGDFFYNSPGPNEPAYSTGNGPHGGGSGGGGHH